MNNANIIQSHEIRLALGYQRLLLELFSCLTLVLMTPAKSIRMPDPTSFFAILTARHCWVSISGLAAAPDQWGFRLYGGKPLQRG